MSKIWRIIVFLLKLPLGVIKAAISYIRGENRKSGEFSPQITEAQLVANFRRLRLALPNLGKTNWTKEDIERLSDKWEEHVDSCNPCLDSLLNELATDPKSAYYCEAGDALLMAECDATLEWAWQENTLDLGNDELSAMKKKIINHLADGD